MAISQLVCSAGDNVVFNADIDSNLIPDDDDTYDLVLLLKWRDLILWNRKY